MALEGIDKAIGQLKSLISLGTTAERYSLLGSAYKRKLMVLKPDSKKEFLETLKLSAEVYFEAAKVKKLKDSYAINNAIQLGRIYELLSGEEFLLGEKPKIKLRKLLEDLVNALNDQPKEKKGYWDFVTDNNLMLSAFTLEKKPSEKKWKFLQESYLDLWQRAGSPSDKKAEEEHLEILLKGLEFAESAEGKELKDSLLRLKDEIG